MQKFIATFLLAFALCIRAGGAIECFACTSITSDSGACGDPFGGSPTTTPKCSATVGDEGVCVKQIISVPMGEGQILRTTSRLCQLRSARYCEILQTTLEHAATIEHCSICTGDFCNSGPRSVVVSSGAILLVLAATLKHAIFP